MAKKKKRVLISTAAAVARLDKMTPLLSRNILNAIRIEAALVAGNDIVGAMERRNIAGASAYNTIARSLAYDLAMHLARLYDLSRMRQPVTKQNVASIPFMVKMLRQKRCQKALHQRARQWFPEEYGLADKCERDCQEAIERALEAYKNTFLGPDGRSGLKAVKAFRDDFLAHSLIKDTKADVLYRQLYRLTDAARDFVEHAMLALDGNNTDLLHHEEVAVKDAQTFWAVALLQNRPA